MGTPGLKNVYFTSFTNNEITIIQNVNLGKDGIAGQLADNGVIDEECVDNISKLSLTDKEGRGKVLTTYLLSENDVDIYEGFLNVWGTYDAYEIRRDIHKTIQDQGLKVPKIWAKRPT